MWHHGSRHVLLNENDRERCFARPLPKIRGLSVPNWPVLARKSTWGQPFVRPRGFSSGKESGPHASARDPGPRDRVETGSAEGQMARSITTAAAATMT